MQLNTITWGTGRRSALLLHGITSNAGGWWRLGPAMADLGFTVVAADLRGHGDSPPSSDHRLSSYTADVMEVGAEWDVVLGHSVGGAVATLAAAQDREWARHLILEDPAIVLPDLVAATAWLVDEFDEDLTPEALAAAHPRWAPEDAEWKSRAMRSCGPEVVELAFSQNDPWDLRAAVASLTVPTTVIGADPAVGALVPPFLGRQLAANPAVTFIQVMGSHSMHRDAWDAFWEAVSARVAAP